MSGQGPSSGNFVASELNYLVVNYLEQCTSVDRVVLSQLKRSLESQREFGTLRFSLFEDAEGSSKSVARPVQFSDLQHRFRGSAGSRLVSLYRKESTSRSDAVVDSAQAKERKQALTAECKKLFTLRDRLRKLVIELEQTCLSLGRARSGKLPVVAKGREESESTVALGDARSLRYLQHRKEELTNLKKSIESDIISVRKRVIPELQDSSFRPRRLDFRPLRWRPRRFAETYMSNVSIIKKITGHRSNVYCVKIDSTGRWIVSGSDDRLVKLWNARTGLLCCTFRGHTGYVCDIALYEKKQLLATSSVDTTVRLWEMLTGRPVAVLTAHRKTVGPLRFDSGVLISTSDDGTCCVWDADRILKEANLARDRCLPTTSASSPRANLISTTGASQTHTAGEESNAAVSAQELAQAGFSNNFIAAASGANLIEEQEVAASQQGPRTPIVLPHLDNSAKRVDVSCVSVRPGGGFVVTGSDDGTGRVWTVERTVSTRCRRSTRAMTMPDLVKGTYVDGSTRLVCLLRGHSSGITQVSWSNDGRRVLSGSLKDGTVRIWYWPSTDIFTTPHHKVLSLHHNVFSAFGASSATSSTDPPRRSTRRAKKLPTLDACAWNADDSRVVTMQSISTNSSATGQRNLHLDPDIFSDQQVKVWDPYTCKVLHTLRMHRRSGYCIVPNPNYPNIAATLAHDGFICVWDIMQGKLLSKIMCPSVYGPAFVLDAVFTPTGTSPTDLVATDSLGRLIFLGTDPALLAAAPSEQFFENDYAELIHDDNMNALDAQTSLPVHLIPPQRLCDTQMVAYSVQPPPRRKNEGRYVVPRNDDKEAEWTQSRFERNRRAMETMVRPLEKMLQSKERNMMGSLEAVFAKMDERIEQEKAKEVSPNQSRGAGGFSPEPQQRQQPQNRRRQARTGMLAVEVDSLERANRRQSEQATLSESESDQEQKSESNINSRRRRAARRAVSRIQRVQEFVNDGDDNSVEDNDAYSEGDNDSSDEAAGRNVRRSNRVRSRPKVWGQSDEEESESDAHSYHSLSSVERRRRAQRKRRRALARKLSDGSLHSNQNPTENPYKFNRDWLQQTELPKQGEYYVPQIGDIVVYCVQGHQQFLSLFPTEDVPPWRTNNWRSPAWPFVLCRVDGLSYDFPPYTNSNAIVCNIELTIIAVPAQASGGSWIRQRGSRHTSLKKFTVQLQPYEFPEFITLKERVQCGLDYKLQVGDKVISLFLGPNNSQEFYHGEVVDTLDSDPQQWPGSPWDSIKVSWNAKEVDGERTDFSGDPDIVSPWDLQKQDTDFAPWNVKLTENKWSEDACANLLEKLTGIMETEECAEPFIDPVPLESVPSYGSIVPLPMDLTTICSRLKNGYYRHLEAVRGDLQLIHDNCLRFNVENCRISNLAKRLLPLLLNAVGETELDEDALNATNKSTAPVLSRLQAPQEQRSRRKIRVPPVPETDEQVSVKRQSAGARSTRAAKRSLRSVAVERDQHSKRRKVESVSASTSSTQRASTRSSRRGANDQETSGRTTRSTTGRRKGALTRKCRRKTALSYKEYDSHQENEELNANDSSLPESSSESQYEPE